MDDAEPKKKRNTARIDIDLKLIDVLSEAGCSVEEICAMLQRSGVKMHLRTLKRRMTEPDYLEARDRGRLIGRAKLRSNMIRLSRLSNSAGATMSIFLAKNWLGMTDKTAEVNVTVENRVEVQTPHERFIARLDRGADRVRDRITALAAAVGANRGDEPIVSGGANDAHAAGSATEASLGTK
jgi:hypothetical protein